MLVKRKTLSISLALALAMFAVACKKKTPLPPPPPPPQPPITADNNTRPTVPGSQGPTIAQFSAEPTSIQRGQSSTLSWQVSGNATSVSIDQSIGTVQNTGNRRVFPSESTTYTLTATGPGGNTTASATVSVSSPPPPPPPEPPGGQGQGTFEQRLANQIQDAYFDYDKSDIGAAAQNVLSQDAVALKAILNDFPNATIVIEGHCDERGSAEYNLGLGDRRASSAKEYLQQIGLPADRVKTISYGKERPQCTEQNDSCWQKNRRVHFSPGQ